MAVTQKTIDISNTEYNSELEWASANGYWLNLLNGITWDEKIKKYRLTPLKYSTVSLYGEKIRFGDGQEFQVIFSCLASEYLHKQKVKDEFNDKIQWLKDQYNEQVKLKRHIDSNNTDLKKLRAEGALANKEDLADGLD